MDGQRRLVSSSAICSIRPPARSQRFAMPIEFSCPTCGGKQTIPDNLAGQLVRCGLCQATFTAADSTDVPVALAVEALPEVLSADDLKECSFCAESVKA